MTKEDDGELQTCSEVEQTIGAWGKRSEGMVALLELVRSSSDDRRDVLVTGAASLIRSSPEKKMKWRR